MPNKTNEELEALHKTWEARIMDFRAGGQSHARWCEANGVSVHQLQNWSQSTWTLTWAEYERLLALYFLDHGYEVEETGVGGSDGGVDLVITDKRTRERTAVQAKHWNDRRQVGPNVIRELHSARLNTKPTCLYAMLITSSDVSSQAERKPKTSESSFGMVRCLDKRGKWQGMERKRTGRA